MYKYKNNS